MQVQPNGTGAFQIVAASTGSPRITMPVSLGSLWQSLPDLSDTVPLPGAQCPAALLVLPEEPPAFSSGGAFPTRILFFQPPGATVVIHEPLPEIAAIDCA